ncbi:hypothetical protein [Methylophaga thiooxydans]|uniref:hypothetical protein n=1 Tax=Methylophaga thiooxydans TaxID=392484 RepID=UPI002357F40A|nr:hypothetical protein [Methylophaga thiooxydans]
MKTFYILISLLMTFSVTAADNTPYEHEGIVTAQTDNPQEIEISNQVYDVNLQTTLHGSILGGELGPILRTGDEVGFNIELRDNKHYITDIWALENDDD